MEYLLQIRSAPNCWSYFYVKIIWLAARIEPLLQKKSRGILMNKKSVISAILIIHAFTERPALKRI